MRFETACKRLLFGAVVFCVLGAMAHGAWKPGACFRIGETADRPCLVSPDGKPFKSVGMVWAYGPERGPGSGKLTRERLVTHLQLIKDLGFNTLNLYGDQLIPEMLQWCDENELAVYFRTSYYSLPNFPGDLREHPDYMNPEFRQAAKESYRGFIEQVRGHPSVLAIDMDHRWLFPLDWSGAERRDQPMVREHGIAHFPRWLSRKYGSVEALNAAWGTSYKTVEEVLKDPRLFRDGSFAKLGDHPARVDAYLYTLWTAADFLADLSRFLQRELPGVLVTPTTEHPECIPETSPRPSSGVAFMSPVHYNKEQDFERDLPSLCKLIYETRWHYDMQGGPPYVSETGFRTDALEQKPPVRTYAWLVPASEEVAARVYAEQFALMNVLPWISGYGFFKLYDKVPEGDFGYLRDDGTKKPLAFVGDAINRAFEPNEIEDPEPKVWIYYPEYAQASARPGFAQLKCLVAAWEKPFLDALRENVDRHWKGLRAGDRKAGRKFAEAVTKDFHKRWFGFAFTKSLPDPSDQRPIVLLSSISEILSAEDREALKTRKTIAFGDVGVRDTAMRPTFSWSLESLGVSAEAARERCFRLGMSDAARIPVRAPPDAPATNPPILYLPSSEYEQGVRCEGQGLDLPRGRYTRVEFLAGSEDGNAAPFFDVIYGDGSWKRAAFAPTISDVRYPPLMTPGVEWEGRHLSAISVVLDPTKVPLRLELPDAPWVRIYGLLLVEGGVARDVALGVGTPGGIMRGRSSAWRVLSDKTAGEARVLERFETGEPAVLAAGPHVTFLYDPLTWDGKPDEISRDTVRLRQSLDEVLRYLDGVKSDE